MTELFANSGDPDQTPRSVASYLGLHCLSITLLEVSRLQWVKPFQLCRSVKPYASSIDPDETSRIEPSYQDLQCLLVC